MRIRSIASAMAELSVGKRQIPLVLVRNLRARRYVLRVRPDGVARVTIPRGGSIQAAKEFAERHTDWLARQLQRIETQPARPAAWTLGSEILFRGERVRLEAGVDGAATTIRLGSESFAVAPKEISGNRWNASLPEAEVAGSPTPGVSAKDLRPVVEEHLRRLAEQELPPRVFGLASLHQLAVRRVTVRNQQTRWGSCSRRGTISLNWRLVQTPAFVSDYIILHELVHLREMNHSKRFWREVEHVCPGYKEAERWLKRNSSLLTLF
jgi:predicted metal-dependent hydrolase